MESIVIKGNLTPDFVNEKLGPFLESIQNIQHVFDEIKQVPPSPVKVNEISWEGVDTIESDTWSEVPKATIFINQAKKALAGLRETLDYLNEEPSNQGLHLSSVRMARSLYETLSVSIESDIESLILTRNLTREFDRSDRIRRIRQFEAGHLGANNYLLPLLDLSLDGTIAKLLSTDVDKEETKLTWIDIDKGGSK